MGHPKRRENALNFQFLAISGTRSTYQIQQCRKKKTGDRDIVNEILLSIYYIPAIHIATDNVTDVWETLPALRLSNQRRDTCQIYILTG